MEEKKNTLPSVDEAKLRIKLYSDLCTDLKGLKRDDVRKILNELDSYVKKIYKTKQLEHEGGFTAETLKYIEDVFITIYKDYGAD